MDKYFQSSLSRSTYCGKPAVRKWIQPRDLSAAAETQMLGYKTGNIYIRKITYKNIKFKKMMPKKKKNSLLTKYDSQHAFYSTYFFPSLHQHVFYAALSVS